MLEWKSPDTALPVLFHGAQTLGSDTSPVNLFLLCDMFRTEVAVQDGILFRYFQGNADNCRGYGAPLSACRIKNGSLFFASKMGTATTIGTSLR